MPIRLDVHAHLAPIDADRLAGLEDAAFLAAEEAMIVDGHRLGVKALFHPDRLIAWMDAQGVERAWISIPPPLYRLHLRGQAAMAWTAYVNDGLERIAAASGGRLEALMHLPIQDPDLSASLAGALVAEGCRRFAAPCGTGDERTLADAAFEPLWQALDAGEAFVFFHPGECADGRLKAFYLSNLVGNPYESTVAVAHLVFAGILDRFPRMTPCFAHGGGFAPMVGGRLQRGFDTERPGIETGVTPPKTALRRLLVDCICHDEHALILAEAAVGPENVVFGSDWPFPMGLIEPQAQMSGFAPDRLHRIFDENPARIGARFGDANKEPS